MGTRIHLVVIALLVLLGHMGPSVFGASEPLEARIRLGKGNARTVVQIVGVEKDGVKLREEGKKFVAKVPFASITTLEVSFPDEVQKALDFAGDQKWQQVKQLLQPLVPALVPLVAIEESNIIPVADTYARALLELNDIDALVRHYQSMSRASKGQRKIVADAWGSYLSARSGDFAAAEKLTKSKVELAESSEAFALRNVAMTYMYRARKKSWKAIEAISLVTALGRLGLNIYPEALYLSALCYHDIAEEEQLKGEAAREVEVERALIVERIRVGREMQKKALDAGTPAPSENEIVAAVDVPAVKASVPAAQILEDIRYWTISQEIFVFIESVFPKSQWAAKSKKKIAKQTRDELKRRKAAEKSKKSESE